MSDWIQVTGGRNPFARTNLMRRQVEPLPGQGCTNCGCLNRYGKLFEYATEHDGINTRPISHGGLFCSKACHDAYNR